MTRLDALWRINGLLHSAPIDVIMDFGRRAGLLTWSERRRREEARKALMEDGQRRGERHVYDAVVDLACCKDHRICTALKQLEAARGL